MKKQNFSSYFSSQKNSQKSYNRGDKNEKKDRGEKQDGKKNNKKDLSEKSTSSLKSSSSLKGSFSLKTPSSLKGYSSMSKKKASLGSFSQNTQESQKFYREKKTLWIWGYHSLLSVLDNKPQDIYKIFLKTSEEKRKLEKKLLSLSSELHLWEKKIFVDASFVQKIPSEAVHQNVAAIIKTPKPITLKDLDPSKGTLLILDGVVDPHNVGALWRSAAALKAQALLITKGNSAPLTGTLLKCASGAAHILPYMYCNNFNETLEFLKQKGFFVVGLSEKGTTALQCCVLNPVALVVGGEGKGLRHLTQKICDDLVFIPTQESFPVLNASVAGSIALYHFSSSPFPFIDD